MRPRWWLSLQVRRLVVKGAREGRWKAGWFWPPRRWWLGLAWLVVPFWSHSGYDLSGLERSLRIRSAAELGAVLGFRDRHANKFGCLLTRGQQHLWGALPRHLQGLSRQPQAQVWLRSPEKAEGMHPVRTARRLTGRRRCKGLLQLGQAAGLWCSAHAGAHPGRWWLR